MAQKQIRRRYHRARRIRQAHRLSESAHFTDPLR
jgi:hypothetical protein